MVFTLQFILVKYLEKEVLPSFRVCQLLVDAMNELVYHNSPEIRSHVKTSGLLDTRDDIITQLLEGDTFSFEFVFSLFYFILCSSRFISFFFSFSFFFFSFSFFLFLFFFFFFLFSFFFFLFSFFFFLFSFFTIGNVLIL